MAGFALQATHTIRRHKARDVALAAATAPQKSLLAFRSPQRSLMEVANVPAAVERVTSPIRAESPVPEVKAMGTDTDDGEFLSELNVLEGGGMDEEYGDVDRIDVGLEWENGGQNNWLNEQVIEEQLEYQPVCLLCPALEPIIQDVGNADADLDEELLSLKPKAFGESSAVRMAYLQAVQGNVYDGLTVKAADKCLNNSLNMLSAVNALPTHPKPVRTVKSARRRLGLDPDQYITQNAICTICWKIYPQDVLNTMPTPRCSVLRCKGIVWQDKKDADGISKRVPAKILPTVSLITELRKMFLRPGFAESLRDNRGDPVNPNVDPDFPMEDIHHGMIWHSSLTNQTREVSSDGSFRDMNTGEFPVRLTSHCYGLHLTANIDWYVISFVLLELNICAYRMMGLLAGRPHLTGAMYIMINDLPRGSRFLQRNVVCYAVLPGPHEPSLEQLNHGLEPLCAEISRLHAGQQALIFINVAH